MVQRDRALPIALTLVMVMAAGCAGWGTDEPADDQDSEQSDADDLEEADGEAQADEGGSDDTDDDGSQDATGSDSQEEDSDPPDTETDASSGGDGDESTDGTGLTGDGDSDSSSDSDAENDCETCRSDSDAETDTGTSDGDVEDSSDEDASEGDVDDSTDETDAGSDRDTDSDTETDDGSDDAAADDDGTSDGDDSDTDGDDDQDDGDDEPYGTLTVTVEDSDGERVSGVEVVGIGPEGEIYSAETDDSGQVTFDLSDGEYTWYVSTDGGEYDESSEEEITMDGGDQSITLATSSDETDEPETHTLTATVLNPDDEPVEGLSADLHTYDDGEYVTTATTDANGQVTFDVEPGDYELIADVSESEYPDEGTHPVSVTEDSEYTIQLSPEPDDGEDDDEEETNTLTVNLANDDVDGVEITVQRTGGPDVEPETTSKASAGGQASFELEPGHYYADAEGYVGTLTAIDVTEDAEITLQNESGATVPVEVTDAETGEPIEGAEISGVCHLNYSTGEVPITGTTGEDGVAQAHADVTPAQCTGVRISADGYEDGHVDINVPVEQPVTVELAPAEGKDNGDEVRHRLTVNLANDDVDGVAVTTERDAGPGEDPEKTTKASAGGQVSFQVPDGLYYVDAEGYNYTLTGIEVEEDREITLQKLEPEAVEFTVTDAETGEPIEGAEVSGVCSMWYSSGDSYIDSDETTDENGVVTARTELTPTDCFTTDVGADGYETTTVSVSVPEDDRVSVELTPEDSSDDGDADDAANDGNRVVLGTSAAAAVP